MILNLSGVSSKVRELKQDIEEGKEIDWELYPVHVLTSVFKSFLREMPEPLLTFDLYDEILRAGDLTQQEDRILTLFALLKKLPKPNFDLVERLVFHLARYETAHVHVLIMFVFDLQCLNMK
jgi:myosin-9